MRSGVLAEQQQAKSVIVGLLEHIGRGLEDTTNMPNADAMSKLIECILACIYFNLSDLNL
jgi:hypothetical protein